MAVRMGRYEVIRPIASGGMATVYLGRALGAGGFEGFERLVAIKAMHPHLVSEREHVAMFLDEAYLAAQIRHPNVVATIAVVQDATTPFMVMEYIEGPSLRKMSRVVRKNEGPLPLDLVLRVFVDVLSGLHAAHELSGHEGKPLNVVHRDVSPQNVLVGTDGVARITDFGVARAELRLPSTKSGHLKGKMGYMPPEQVRGLSIDRRVDVYAAGAVLWECLAGEKLFRAASEAELVLKLISGASTTPREVNDDVPEPIDRVCMTALKLGPEQRYPTAADFIEALDEAAAEAGIRIATTRRVSDFVKKLGVHKAPPEPTTPPDFKTLESSSTPFSLLKDSSSDSQATLGRLAPGGGDAHVSEPPKATSDRPESNATHTAAVMSERKPRPTRQRKQRLALLAAGAAAAAVIIGLVSRGPQKPASGSASPAASDPNAAQAATKLASSPPSTAVRSGEPSATGSTAAPSTETATAQTRRRVRTTRRPRTATPTATPTETPPEPTTTTPEPSTTRKGPGSYHPPDL